jgi:ribose 5-phosphate isomerase A
LTPSEAEKAAAARAALAEVRHGMRLGLGTGSTVAVFLPLLAEKVEAGLDALETLDLTIDGADEIDPKLNLVKGGGGALVREKIVAANSRRLVIIADHSKQVAMLGGFPLAVEIIPFGAAATLRRLAALMASSGSAGQVSLRRDNGAPLRSDNGNLLADLCFGVISDPVALARALADMPGVVDHGLFLDMAACAYLGTPHGVQRLHP